MKKENLALLLITSIFYSCGDCQTAIQSQKKINFEVILTEKPYIYGELNLTGRKINSNEILSTQIMSRWYRAFIDSMEVGDTIIKREGELPMYIHKKDTILRFDYDCDGKTYK